MTKITVVNNIILGELFMSGEIITLDKKTALVKLPQSFQVLDAERQMIVQMNGLSNNISQNEKIRLKSGFQGRLKWIVPLVIFFVSLFLIFGVLQLLSPILNPIFNLLRISTGMLMTPIFIISIALAAWIPYYYKKSKTDKIDEENGMLNDALLEANDQVRQYRRSDEYKEAISNLPKEYQNPAGVAGLYNMFATGRADTWKEAINGLDLRNFQTKVLNNQQEGLRAQRQEIELAKRNNILLQNIDSATRVQTAQLAAQATQLAKLNATASSVQSDVKALLR